MDLIDEKQLHFNELCNLWILNFESDNFFNDNNLALGSISK